MNESQKTERNSDEKKRKRKRWLLLLLLIPFLLLALSQCHSCEEKCEKMELEDSKNWDGQLPQNGERPMAGDDEGIEIPGYSQVYGPEIQLINPKNNDVYFAYKIYKDEALVYETKLISPNQVATFNSADVLGTGRHQVRFEINTYDLETNESYNGATMNVEIINE